MEKTYFLILFLSLVSLSYLSWQDFKTQGISRNITFLTLFFVFAFNSISFVFYQNSAAYDALLGGLFLGLVFFFCVLLTKERALGMGDVYIFILMGFLVGLENIFFALSIMVFSALIFSLVKYKEISLKQKIPLVPFITLGIFLTNLLVYLFL